MQPGSKLMTDWLRALLHRKPRKLAAVALANKMARVAWALMARGEVYRRSDAITGAAATDAASGTKVTPTMGHVPSLNQ